MGTASLVYEDQAAGTVVAFETQGSTPFVPACDRQVKPLLGIPAGTWLMVAFAYDTSTGGSIVHALHAGGVSSSGGSGMCSPAATVVQPTSVVVGGPPALVPGGFSGLIDTVMVFDRALDVTELQLLRDYPCP